jgi:hypothetical protein
MQENGQEREPGEEAPESGDETPTPKQERKHRATYARDNKNGGYLIRVAGPYPEKFAGRDVPVVLKSGKEHNEKLAKLIWTGADAEAGRVALYTFEAKPRDTQTEVAF